MSRAVVRLKRPCRICRRWFTPNPKLKDRQKTCGDGLCKREWHRKKCSEWNKKNADYFRSNYLQKKLEEATAAKNTSKILPLKSRLSSGLPHSFVQEVIGIQHLIIIEYFGQLLFGRFQEVLRGQLIVNTEQISGLPDTVFSRTDRL
jgi:hypothetical protein